MSVALTRGKDVWEAACILENFGIRYPHSMRIAKSLITHGFSTEKWRKEQVHKAKTKKVTKEVVCNEIKVLENALNIALDLYIEIADSNAWILIKNELPTDYEKLQQTNNNIFEEEERLKYAYRKYCMCKARADI